MNVFLDDTRPQPEGYVGVKTTKQAIEALRKHSIQILSLDYDLGRGMPKGIEVVRFMVRHSKYPNHIILHTANPIGRRRMYDLLMAHKPDRVKVTIHPLPWI
ncbi:cyclic-phosphate processing receiver domain-containing protein [Ferviditalea candida]|uniref:Cyclic-phosphate processing receiver domain-containing protein n=1 Tax=Ferviditalea candida TaxID=3108399 RepID=A0ABU5ZHK9_9BACL|nr:cyclic-phosphate processing receiver domain-containing protein [Paenibacillaceae bacterium T2]